MTYNDITRQYFEAAPNAGTLPGSPVSSGAAGNREQGIRVQFQVRIEAGQVRAARFLAFGCPHTIAVCAFLASGAEGRAVSRELPLTLDELMRRFAMPAEKRGRLLVVEDAWRAAMAG